MLSLTVEITGKDARVLYGVRSPGNDKTMAAGIRRLSAAYRTVTSSRKGAVWPFFVLTRNYDPQTRNFELFIGSDTPAAGLEAMQLPAGEYAKITVRPVWGFFWGAAIGRAKRYFYTEWLPQSPYRSLNLEYECHTAEKSAGRHPSVDILFAIVKRE
ncbi:MAG: GyrI-like domain-containing protein [Parabacteroides sp.]|nr:GyrI-like domain-containing protein [Parabacteroides sp.]